MTTNGRILVLAWSAPHLGFALFDQPTHLLTSGLRSISRRNSGTSTVVHLQRQSRYLIARFSPSVIVVDVAANQKRIHSNTLGKIARREAKASGIEVVSIRDREIQNVFGKFTAVTRYDIAAWSTIFFPTLTKNFSYLDRKPQYTPLFDAVAAGVGYLGQFGEYELKLSSVNG